MNLTKLAIGGDINLTVVLPLPISSYKNVAIWLIDSKCRVFGKYSIEPLEGHIDADVEIIDPDAEGRSIIEINVQKSATKQASEGVCTIEIYEAINNPGLEGESFAEIPNFCPIAYLFKPKIAKAVIHEG